MSLNFENEYKKFTDEQKRIKNVTAEEAKQVQRRLSPSDVSLLKSFFGYTSIRQIPGSPSRSIDEAPVYIVECLFHFGKNNKNDDKNDNDNIENDKHKNDKKSPLKSDSNSESFDLECLISKSPTKSNFPRIFEQESIGQLVKIFKEGSLLDSVQQVAFLRLWQVMK